MSRASIALTALRNWDTLAPKCAFNCGDDDEPQQSSFASAQNRSVARESRLGARSPAAEIDGKQPAPTTPNRPTASPASPPPFTPPSAAEGSTGGDAAMPPLALPATSCGAAVIASHSHFMRLRESRSLGQNSRLRARRESHFAAATSSVNFGNHSDAAVTSIPPQTCFLAQRTHISRQEGQSAPAEFASTVEDARLCSSTAEDEYRLAVMKETGEGSRDRKTDEAAPVLNKTERAIAAMRSVVSQNKIRFQEDGFDLDLTYITPRIIAMGFPSTGRESYFRNPMPEVERFFAKRHPNHFRVYNLCRERDYDSPTRFSGRHRRFGFDDHNAPADIAIIPNLLRDATDFLKEDEDNVVAIHCKAGKGRTGLIISCLLMATEPELREPQKALEFFSDVRTNDSQGVTIPSQKRYVGYWGRLLSDHGGAAPKEQRKLYFNRVVFHTFIKAKLAAPLDIYFIITQGFDGDVFDSRKVHGASGAKSWSTTKSAYVFDYAITAEADDQKLAKTNERNTLLSPRTFELGLSGDLKMSVYSKNKLMADEELFHFWFNTTLCEYPLLRIAKFDLDGGPNKDKKHSTYAPELAVDLVFEAPQWIAAQQNASQTANAASAATSDSKDKKKDGFFARVFGSKK